MQQQIETVIIGGGQAGLSASYYLTQRGREHVVLEQAAQAGNVWRNDRWDSFTLITPNWSFKLPGMPYQGSQPEGYMERSGIVATFEAYVGRFRLPVKYDSRVTSVEPLGNGGGFRVNTAEASFAARQVVVATGMFQRPRLPSFSRDLSPHMTQLHSGQYRNPAALPPGAVLVVGSGQSGCQIAEELYQSGRKVYLSTGTAGRAPRRYRGKDFYEWLTLIGFFDRTVDMLPSPAARFTASPHLSGRDGGHSLNLYQFARDGVTLLGRIQGGRNNRIWLAQDMKENLAKADQFEAEIVKQVDLYIDRQGLSAPVEKIPLLRDGFAQEEYAELDLESAGVTSLIWANGYSFDFSLVKAPVFDSAGFPLQKRGATAVPGLYFLGLPWLFKMKSGLLVGVGEDAEYLVEGIC